MHLLPLLYVLQDILDCKVLQQGQGLHGLLGLKGEPEGIGR